MLRIKSAGITALTVASIFLSSYAHGNELSAYAESKAPVKVYCGTFTKESGQDNISVDKFKDALAASLKNRKSVKFEAVDNPASSELQVSGVIKKYRYLKDDPITTYASPSGFVLDAVTTENYAELEVNFTVTETKTRKVLWNGTVSNFIKRMMTPEESMPLIYDKVCRTFLWKSFGKPKRTNF